MFSAAVQLILHQTYLHLVSYGLVIGILFVAVADAFLIGHLRRVLRQQWIQLQAGAHPEAHGSGVHPLAVALEKDQASASVSKQLRRQAEIAEAALFVPLRTRMSLTRDLGTLMGLIATLLALVAAACEFARNGKPELLIGSVGTGCVATCVAAVGCAIALWNLSRLARVRLEVACQTEDFLLQSPALGDPEFVEEIPIRHRRACRPLRLNPQPEEHHASV